MEGCLCLQVNIWERENKTKKTKSSFTSKSLSQREQIVQQTLTGFCLFSSMCNLWLFSFSTSHSLSLQLLT